MVRAVVSQPAAETLEALEQQTRPPDEVAVDDFGERAEWLWLLDGSVVPQPRALECLLAELEPPGGGLRPPVLLTSRVVRPDGSLHPSSTPVPKGTDPDLAVAAVQRRTISVRVARSGSLLVRGDTLGPRPADGDYSRWSARLLKSEPGLLVPRSVVVRHDDARIPRELAGRVALLRGDALARAEKPWFAFRLIEDAVSAAARRAGRGGSRPRPGR